MKYNVIFNENFFESLKNRWLNSKEIFLLLENFEEICSILKINILTKNTSIINLNNSINGKYYFTLINNLSYIKSLTKFTKDYIYDIKINGIEKIKCINSSKENYFYRRIYYFINHPKYVFIHYRIINKKVYSIKNPIKIINFNPEFVYENQKNQKLFIVIESQLTYNDLLKFSSNMFVTFGEEKVNLFPIQNNILCCDIPPQNEKEVIINILLNSKKNNSINKISFYDENNKKSFKYIKNENCSLNENKNILTNNYKIFKFSNEQIYINIIKILNIFINQIYFFSNPFEQKKINIENLSFDNYKNFNEENLLKTLNLILIELEKINKINLLEKIDEEGYKLIHFISSLNYVKILELLNSYKINIDIKSKDNLTIYEISAGKRNLECLTKIIEFIDNEKEEKLFDDFYILKSALNIALENKNINYQDIQILDILIKQIKIKYTVQSTTGQIMKDCKINDGHLNDKNETIKIIQRSVKRWLRRNKYKRMKKAANNLIKKLRDSKERKKFLQYKHSTIFIQNQIRKWLEKKK